MPKLLVCSLLIIFFVLGIGAGYSLTPEYTSKMNERNSAMVPLGKADKYVDKRYLDGVIAHHLTAIDLAKQALEMSHREEIRKLAEEIIKVDQASIKELRAYKLSWYKDGKEINAFNKINLGKEGERFDLRFLNALIAHHEEAIETAREISTKSTREEILDLANNIVNGLSASKTTLEEWRKGWYK